MPSSDLQGRKVFQVFNQEFVVDERYNVTKELGQGAYGIVWYASSPLALRAIEFSSGNAPSRQFESFSVVVDQASGTADNLLFVVLRRTMRPARALPLKRSPTSL